MPAGKSGSSRWIRGYRRAPGGVPLFCFPHAGGAVKTILAPGSTIDGVQQTANICSNTANSNGGIFACNDPGRITFLNTGGFYQYTPAKGLKNISITELDGQPLTRLQLVDGNSRERLFIGSTSPSFSAIFAKDRILVKTSGDRPE